jgi:hypothetical protein
MVSKVIYIELLIEALYQFEMIVKNKLHVQ